MLTELASDVFIDTRDAKFFGVECNSRMTIVRLAGGGLFVHSPVAIDEATALVVEGARWRVMGASYVVVCHAPASGQPVRFNVFHDGDTGELGGW